MNGAQYRRFSWGSSVQRQGRGSSSRRGGPRKKENMYHFYYIHDPGAVSDQFLGLLIITMSQAFYVCEPSTIER